MGGKNVKQLRYSSFFLNCPQSFSKLQACVLNGYTHTHTHTHTHTFNPHSSPSHSTEEETKAQIY